MRRIFLTLMASITLCSVMAQQSKTEKSVFGEVTYKVDGFSSKTKTNAFQANFGWNFNRRFYALAQVESTLMLKKAETKTYFTSLNLGGGVGVHLATMKSAKLDGLIDLKLTAGSTIGNSDWKYTFYDFGIQAKFNRNVLPVLGFGYRRYSSRQDAIPNHNGIYVSLGFLF